MQAVPENKAIYLTAEAILNAKDILEEEVTVNEWGGVVRVRGMTAGERVEYSGIFVNDNMPADAQARMAQMCIIDHEGERLFTPEQIEALSGKSPKALEQVTTVIMRLSGMDEATEKN